MIVKEFLESKGVDLTQFENNLIGSHDSRRAGIKIKGIQFSMVVILKSQTIQNLSYSKFIRFYCEIQASFS